MSIQPPANYVAIRLCTEADAAAITGIYAHHVLHGLASFEIEPPSENDMQQRRLEIIGGGFPYLMAERAREIVGYTYASPYRSRPAYRYTVEKLSLPAPGLDRSGHRSTADVRAAHRVRRKRGYDKSWPSLATAPTAPRSSAARLCNSGDHLLSRLQIWTLGRYRADAAIARGRRQHIAVRRSG
jgi:hypothetical protein